jgi:hypothetical protein
MEILKEAADPLEAALPMIGQKSFPGMSADEVDAFTLGYYTGAVAHALVTRENVVSVDEIAERVDAEMTRIEHDGDEAT